MRAMPLYLRAPLPGPFVYARRIGGRRRRGRSVVTEILVWSIVGPLWLSWLVIKWTALALVWLILVVVRLITAL